VLHQAQRTETSPAQVQKLEPKYTSRAYSDRSMDQQTHQASQQTVAISPGWRANASTTEAQTKLPFAVNVAPEIQQAKTRC
jgi:hypothetical protein